MNSLILLNDVSDVAIWASAIVVTLFLVRYTMMAPWWKSPVGSTIALLDILLDIVFVPAAIMLLFPTLHFFRTLEWRWVTVLSILAIPIVVGYRLVFWENVHSENLTTRMIAQYSVPPEAREHK